MQEENIITANENKFTAGNYSEALTAFTVGWVDPDNIASVLDFIAPPVPVGRRFEFKRSDNAQAFLSENDDVRAIGSEFKRVRYDGESVNEPILSNFILKTGMAVNILSADVKQISGKRYGQMMLEMPASYEDRSKLITTLRDMGLTAEEVHL